MIRFSDGDLLTCGAELLVNPVNCVGVMGKGLALAFKNAFPGNFTSYARACSARQVRPGVVYLTHNPNPTASPRWIANFPTKRHWRDASQLTDIDAGLVALVAHVRRLEAASVAVPALGCGLGGLDWTDVLPRIEAAFAPLPNVDVVVFPPR